MPPDLHLDPDVVAHLAATARRIADGLPMRPPTPPRGETARPIRDAAAELVAFADAAEAVARRVRQADETAARGFRTLDAASGLPGAHALGRPDGTGASGPASSTRSGF